MINKLILYNLLIPTFTRSISLTDGDTIPLLVMGLLIITIVTSISQP